MIQDSAHFKQIKETDIMISILLAQADSKHGVADAYFERQTSQEEQTCCSPETLLINFRNVVDVARGEKRTHSASSTVFETKRCEDQL